jgi:hypothetical protein
MVVNVTEIHIVEPVGHRQSAFEVEMAIETLKRYK